MSGAKERDFYQIAMSEELKDVFLRELEAVAREEGGSPNDYSVSQGDPSSMQNALQFEPITTAAVAWYIANVVISGTAGYFIGKALDRLMRRETLTTIIVVDPSGDKLRLDPNDQAQLEVLLAKLKQQTA